MAEVPTAQRVLMSTGPASLPKVQENQQGPLGILVTQPSTLAGRACRTPGQALLPEAGTGCSTDSVPAGWRAHVPRQLCPHPPTSLQFLGLWKHEHQSKSRLCSQIPVLEVKK